MSELQSILEKFAASGWDLIAAPSQAWLDGRGDKAALIHAIQQATENAAPAVVRLTPYINGRLPCWVDCRQVYHTAKGRFLPETSFFVIPMCCNNPCRESCR